MRSWTDFRAEVQLLESRLEEWSTNRAEARFVHSSAGAEYCAFAVTAALQGVAVRYTLYYRCHSWLVGILGDRELAYEAIVGVNGLEDLHVGPMHPMAQDCQIIEVSALVGAQAPIAIGSALANDAVKTVCVLGDGALSSGPVLEALNIANVLRLDIVWVIEDNQRSIEASQGTVIWATPDVILAGLQVPTLTLDISTTPADVGLWLTAQRGGPCAVHFKYRPQAAHCHSMEPSWKSLD